MKVNPSERKPSSLSPTSVKQNLGSRGVRTEHNDSNGECYDQFFNYRPKEKLWIDTEKDHHLQPWGFSDKNKNDSILLNQGFRGLRAKSLLSPNKLLEKNWYEEFVLFFENEASFVTKNFIPPITSAHLKKLDISNIMQDVQIRHSLVLNPNQMISPIELNEAQKKEADAFLDHYWRQMQREIHWIFEWKSFYRFLKHDDPHIQPPALLYSMTVCPLLYMPCILNEMKEILINLLYCSKEDKLYSVIHSHFDLSGFFSQIQMGQTPNVSLLIDFLFSVLSDLINETRYHTVKKIKQLLAEENFLEVMKEFLILFEALKLDDTNRRIAQNIPIVLKEAAEFESRHFIQSIRYLKIFSSYTENWIHRQYQEFHESSIKKGLGLTSKPSYLDIYYFASMDLITSDYYWLTEKTSLPETFQLDAKSLKSIYYQIKNILICQICSIIYKMLVKSVVYRQDLFNKLRFEVNQLLCYSAVKASDIFGYLLRHIEVCFSHPLTPSRKKEIYVKFVRLLKPNNEVNKLLTNRLKSILFYYLKKGKLLDHDKLKSIGWLEYSDDLHDICKNWIPIVELNRTVYGHFYTYLLDNEKKPDL